MVHDRKKAGRLNWLNSLQVKKKKKKKREGPQTMEKKKGNAKLRGKKTPT